MSDQPIAAAKRAAKAQKYDPNPFIERVQVILVEKNLSLREASLGAGLHHQAIRRIMNEGKQPSMAECMLLANFLGVNPNEFLILGGWPAMKVFDIQVASAENLPTEAVDVALDIAKIADPATRKSVALAVRTLLKKYFEE